MDGKPKLEDVRKFMSDHFGQCSFICPKCGCTYYGTSQIGSNNEKGHCHGPGCKFTWPRSEDGEHFYLTVKVNDALRQQ